MAAEQTTADPSPEGPIEFHGKPGELRHFAYGANMNPEQIGARCANPEVFCLARLPGFRVVFHGHSRVWDGAVETIEPAPGQEIWGVVYALSPRDRDRLDTWQDVRLDGTGAYFHWPARVTDPQGAIHTVLLYKKDQLGPPALPSREYLEFIVAGAVARGLPGEYVDGLRRMASRPAGYPVPRQGTFSRELLVDASCAGCGDEPPV